MELAAPYIKGVDRRDGGQDSRQKCFKVGCLQTGVHQVDPLKGGDAAG